MNYRTTIDYRVLSYEYSMRENNIFYDLALLNRNLIQIKISRTGPPLRHQKFGKCNLIVISFLIPVDQRNINVVTKFTKSQYYITFYCKK